MVSLEQGWTLQGTLQRLVAAITEQNKPGSVEGLLAKHVLRAEPFYIDWNVTCSDHWISSQFSVASLPAVSALGYSMSDDYNSAYEPSLREGLNRVMSRDPALGAHLSITHSPALFLGLLLGILTLKTDKTQELAWCRRVVADFPGADVEVNEPLFAYIRCLASGSKIRIPILADCGLYPMCFYEWALRRQLCENLPGQEDLRAARRKMLNRAVTELQVETAYHAAFIWSAVHANVFHAIDSSLLNPHHVAAVLENFADAMRRWRWDELTAKRAVRWPIVSEREVQDVLWLILRSYFPDVVDEDTLPKFGHASYRIDFGIPSLGLIIEVKYAADRADFRRIEKEILEDLVPYLSCGDRYHSLLVFIYDASSSVQEHGTTKQCLKNAPGVSDVVIACRPSQIPVP